MRLSYFLLCTVTYIGSVVNALCTSVQFHCPGLTSTAHASSTRGNGCVTADAFYHTADALPGDSAPRITARCLFVQAIGGYCLKGFIMKGVIKNLYRFAL